MCNPVWNVRILKYHLARKVERPFHTVHVDHLGPFVRSKRRNAYILLIIDAFTKFIMLVPVKSTKSIHSITTMKNYFHLFGVPTRVIYDRRTSFISKGFQEYLHSLGIKHIMNAVATPRANVLSSALSAINHGKPEICGTTTFQKSSGPLIIHEIKEQEKHPLKPYLVLIL